MVERQFGAKGRRAGSTALLSREDELADVCRGDIYLQAVESKRRENANRR